MAAGSLTLFLSLGLAGSAGPGHFGFRVLAYRHHLDRGYPFVPGSEDGGWGYSWWLMRGGHHPLSDSALNFFGTSAGIMGWLTLIGGAGMVSQISLQL